VCCVVDGRGCEVTACVVVVGRRCEVTACVVSLMDGAVRLRRVLCRGWTAL
jgi:hypothetical protein